MENRAFQKPAARPPVARTPTVHRWRSALAYRGAPHTPERIDTMLDALAELTRDRNVRVRFSNWSGLVRSLRGDLWDEPVDSAGQMLEVAGSFLEKHQQALVGGETRWAEDTVDVEDGYPFLRHGPVIGRAARFRQQTARGVPVYGAKALFGFSNAGFLTLCQSSWLALPVDYEPAEEIWGDRQRAVDRAIQFVVTKDRDIDPWVTLDRDSLQVWPAPGTHDGQVLLPDAHAYDVHGLLPFNLRDKWRWVVAGAETGLLVDWVPVWMFWIGVPQTANTWQVSVIPLLDEVFGFELSAHGAKSMCVYETVEDARLDNRHNVVLEVPGGPPLANASDFPLDVGAEPGLCVDDQLRSGTVYYHVQRGLKAFRDTIVPANWSAPGFTIPGDGSPLHLSVTSDATDGRYSQQNGGSLIFGQGVGSVGNVALDPDVILHEYAHSLIHRVQPDLFHVSSAFGWAINEGLAFYYGCSVNRPHAPDGLVRWGEVAYGGGTWTVNGFRDVQRDPSTSQAANFDFFAMYNLFPDYSAGLQDPLSPTYACGMVLARTLWELRRSLGTQMVDALVLRALNATGGLQSEMESLAEAFLHYELEQTTATHHESLVRLIFCSRGIAADAAIHDLHTLRWNGTDLVLAATEGGAISSCRISTDGGLSWNDLGTGGLAEAVALASVDLGAAGALVFAGGEVWTGNPPRPAHQVFSYALAAGALDLGNPWQQMPALPDPASGVLCLLALPAAAGAYWLFAGTERGLWRFSSATNQWDRVTSVPTTIPVFDLTVDGNPLRLVAVAREGTYVVDIQNLAQRLRRVPGNYVMATSSDGATANDVVMGSAFDGVGRLDVMTLAPAVDLGAPNGFPVFSLWTGQETIQGAAQTVVYAGTSVGVFRKVGNGNWEEISLLLGAGAGNSPAHTTVVALARVGNRLLAATTERGLWSWDLTTTHWARVTSGLPRTGRLTDLPIPTSLNGWSATLIPPAALDLDATASHVFYLPAGLPNQRLRFTPNSANVTLLAYYVSPHTNIDPAVHILAGLQPLVLNSPGGTAQQVSTETHEGYYVLVVRSQASNVNYQVAVTIDLIV